jgi:transcriptional regulator with XRE-family HTH domain
MAEDSPTVARRRVRLALREAREHADLTQLQVAEEMEWSLSKVIRIENGDVSISPNDLRPLLGYLGVKDRAQINALVADAKLARTRQRRTWWQEPAFRDLSEPLRRLIEFEAVAFAIRNYSTIYIPGPLQIPEYSSALTGSLEEISTEQIDSIIDARRQRRNSVMSRLGSSLKFFTLLDESVFMRPIGGHVDFAEQLRDMHRLAEQGLINVRMLPFETHVSIPNNATYDLVSLGEETGDEVLYRENGITDELIEDKSSIARHLNRFNQLWLSATDETNTIRFIEKRIKELENTITRSQR